jgi:hypothetical protein
VLYPMASFSGALFAMTWFSDVLGVSGLSRSLDRSRPVQKQSFLDFHFAHQEDHQSPYHRFLNFTAQYGRDDFYENLELYVMGGMRRQQSEEGIALTHLDMPLHVDLDLGWFIPTLKHVYFQNWISYGYQWFHFNGKTDFINDMSIGQMSFGQRLRFYFSDYLQIGTGYHRENNQLLGGTDFLLMVFHHDLRFDYNGFLSQWKFSHGLGYRLSGSLGVQF